MILQINSANPTDTKYSYLPQESYSINDQYSCTPIALELNLGKQHQNIIANNSYFL